MKFNEFLWAIGSRNNIAKSVDLYEFFGGQKKLKISMRNFYLLESGKAAPTFKTFIAIFNQLGEEDYKEAIQSYIESEIPGGEAAKLKKYLSDSLHITYSNKIKSIWEMGKNVKMLSESQLDLLKNNSQALRLFNKLLLNDRITPSDLKNRLDIAKLLVEHELGLWDVDGGLKAINEIVLTPNFDNSPKPTAKKGAEYILNHIPAFHEGTPESEELCYVIQNVPKSSYKNILEQSKSFKKWLQKQAIEKTNDTVPILYIGFTKKLEDKDF